MQIDCKYEVLFSTPIFKNITHHFNKTQRPVNKAARFRFEIIDECLRNTKRKWSKSDILNYVNRRLQIQYDNISSISISQLRYDIENMQYEYDAPIEMYKLGKMYYYRYSNPEFSIKNIPVNEEDIVMLNSAVKMLRQMKGFTIADEVAEIVKRLESRYDFCIEDRRNIIEFDTCDNHDCADNLEDIYHAIIRMNVLKITYHPFHRKSPKVTNVHPYLLKKHCNIWYLVGYSQESGKLEIYEIDRMIDIKISRMPFIIDLFWQLDEYFNDVIGITKPNNNVQNVLLSFSSARSPYIKAYPIHRSQKVVRYDADGTLVVSLSIILNKETVDLLLSYGDDVKVLSPRHLALQIWQTARTLVGYYNTH